MNGRRGQDAADRRVARTRSGDGRRRVHRRRFARSRRSTPLRPHRRPWSRRTRPSRHCKRGAAAIVRRVIGPPVRRSGVGPRQRRRGSSRRRQATRWPPPPPAQRLPDRSGRVGIPGRQVAAPGMTSRRIVVPSASSTVDHQARSRRRRRDLQPASASARVAQQRDLAADRPHRDVHVAIVVEVGGCQTVPYRGPHRVEPHRGRGVDEARPGVLEQRVSFTVGGKVRGTGIAPAAAIRSRSPSRSRSAHAVPHPVDPTPNSGDSSTFREHVDEPAASSPAILERRRGARRTRSW